MSTITNISACLIVKNESENLSRCINSIKRFCDQIVVVDTGSSDNTPQIASNLGCDLYFFKWNDDFSAARNFAIDHAYCDWILSIDADEYVDENFNPILLNIDNNVGGINLQLINFLNDSKDQISKHSYTRIFKNDDRIRFKGRIHEQIRESIEESGMFVQGSNLYIYHTGYINTTKEKKERNKKLLEEEFKKSGDDWNKYNLAETDFSLGNLDRALNLFRTLLNSNELNKDQIQKVKIRLGQIFLSKEKYEEAVSILNFDAFDKDLEGLRKFVLGACYLYLNDYKNSKLNYQSQEVKDSTLVDNDTVYKALFVIEQLQKKS